MSKKSNTRSFERLAKTGGALLAVIAGIRVIKTTVMKEIDEKNQYKGLALPVAAYFASDFLPLDPDLKFGVQLGAGVSLVSGALDAMNMSKTKEQIGLAGDSTKYQFDNLNEIIDFANAQIPAEETLNGYEIEAPTYESLPDNSTPEINGELAETATNVITTDEEEFETNGDYNISQNW